MRAVTVTVMVVMVMVMVMVMDTASGAAPTCKASPAVLETTRESAWANVTLSWSGLAFPGVDDYVAMFAPADNPTPIGMMKLTNASTWSQGFGSLKMPLVNLRTPYVFRVFSRSSKTAAAPVAVATSNEVSFASPLAPQHQRLVMTPTPGTMKVMWMSGAEGTPTAEWGSSPASMDHSATGTSWTYSLSDMCASPANESSNFVAPGFIHAVEMTGLVPDHTYYYRVGDPSAANGGWSQVLTFRSAPKVAAETATSSIVFGDLGISLPFDLPAMIDQQPPSRKTMYWVRQATNAETRPQQIVHVGDVSYSRGYGIVWEWFDTLLSGAGGPWQNEWAVEGPGPAAVVPWMFCVGNHDLDTLGGWHAAGSAWPANFHPTWGDYGNDSGGECGVPYVARYFGNTPQDITGAFYYSYDLGNTHWVFMSSETNFTEGSAQWEWLKNDLASVDRSVTPWVIFCGHRPIVTGSQGFQGTAMNEEFIVSIFQKLLWPYNVDLFIAGHEHKYDRTTKLGYEAYEPGNGPVAVVVGAAGHPYQAGWVPMAGNSMHFFLADWEAFRTDSFGYGVVRTTEDELVFEFHGDQQNLVHDVFRLSAKDQRWRLE